MKPTLTINDLIEEAQIFCKLMSKENHPKLLGVTDGKMVDTYVEHRFQHHLCYLAISNALQWRLQYSRVIALNNKVDGVINYEW